MRGVSGELSTDRTEIGVQPCTGGVKSDPPSGPTKLKAIAPKLWKKPNAAVADIENCSISTAKRILRGGPDGISARLLLAICDEVLKPLD